MTRFDGRECSYRDLATSTYNKALNGTRSYSHWLQPLHFISNDVKTADSATEQMKISLKSENDNSFDSCACLQITDHVLGEGLLTEMNPSSLKLCPDLQDIYLDFEFFQSLDMEMFSHILDDICNQKLSKI